MTSTTLKPSKPKRVYTEEQKKRISARQKIYYAENRSEILAEVKSRRLSDPTRHKSIQLKSTYGITLQERDDMFAAQGGVCAICASAETTGRGWSTDHCHVNGNVRGILCQNCNTGLGMFKDNPDALRAAITYLGK